MASIVEWQSLKMQEYRFHCCNGRYRLHRSLGCSSIARSLCQLRWQRGL
jgi:hypothetical protein